MTVLSLALQNRQRSSSWYLLCSTKILTVVFCYPAQERECCRFCAVNSIDSHELQCKLFPICSRLSDVNVAADAVLSLESIYKGKVQWSKA